MGTQGLTRMSPELPIRATYTCCVVDLVTPFATFPTRSIIHMAETNGFAIEVAMGLAMSLEWHTDCIAEGVQRERRVNLGTVLIFGLPP